MTNRDIEALLRHNVKSIAPYASARDEFENFLSGQIFLDANENPYNNGLNRYPDPHQRKLKERLSALKGIPPENILIGNGSDEILDLLFRAFCYPQKDAVITMPPTYGMYGVLAALNDIRNIKVNLKSNFQPDTDAVLANSSRAKMLFICSPNNPTSNSFEKNTVKTLLENFKGIVVIDEAYVDFSNQESWASRLSEYPNLVVIRTLSKAYGCAGLRVGICLASSLIISTLDKIKPPYNVNALSQEAALKQLENTAGIHRQIEAIVRGRQLLAEQLKNISFVKQVYPSDANFLLIEVDDASKRYRQLIEKHIVVRNRSHEPLCGNCLRITIGTPEENEALSLAFQNLETT